MKWYKKLFRVGVVLASLVIIALVAEFIYFCVAYSSIFAECPASVDLAVVYSGNVSLVQSWQKVCNSGVRLFLTSGVEWSREVVERAAPKRRKLPMLIVENHAHTTDQNARYSAYLIRFSGVHTVALIRPWYHIPRSLFLTRLYLRGSGIKVVPVTADLPTYWWFQQDFWFEMIKFWGSLFRVVLSVFGIEGWPPHFGTHGFEKIKIIN